VKLQDEAGGVIYELPWRRIAPGQFSLSRDLEEGSVVKGAVRVGEHAMGFGPVSVGSSVEWAFDSERLAELREVSHRTNGRELLNLKNAWLRPPYIAANSLNLPLGIALLFLVLVEALITRTGWKLPEFVKRAKAEKVAKPKKAAKVKKSKPVKREVNVEEVPAKTESESISDRRSRFQQAKKRK